jgi:phenazine biosynthesis protein phzE
VGFYNTFVGRVADSTVLPAGVAVDADPETGDVHLVRGPHLRGIQFHAESILTQHGADLIHRLAADLLG